ncbi:hypothetical protein BS47DRAFT_1341929 [Hydnum rufescens UP504]|uniref:RNase III domain-containing protein n=1 Tax=Hydnum rufescens UP504 TaxID=1448309 RepID=A0A9P6B0U5_9AGAM|nr:hypothetical protein BS47DRAFT_1341929 [Hydnum rufescens UP504]
MAESRRVPASSPSRREYASSVISVASAFPNGLPPLPSIRNEHIRKQVFTHKSFYTRPNREFEPGPDDPRSDNESLEHLGDSVLQYCTTLLVRRLYPRLRPGTATHIRSSIVDNRNLAAIAVGYNLSQHLRVSPSAPHIRNNPGLQADAFEAYVGGLHEDQGLELVDTWLTALFTPYIHAMHEDALNRQLAGLNISSPFPEEHRSRPRHRTSSSATSVTTTQTSPTTSFASLTTSTAGAAASTSSEAPQGFAPNGCTAELNERLSQRHQMVQWADVNVAPGEDATFPNWKSTATVDGRLVGTGYGRKIKVSRNVASYRALVALGLKDPTNS